MRSGAVVPTFGLCSLFRREFSFSIRECLAFSALFSNKSNLDYLEFGSGVSTLLAGLRKETRNVVSVEGNPNWMQNVSRKLKQYNIQRKVELRHANIGPVGWLSYPRFRNATALQYCIKPLRGFETFDIVFIDGRFRVACAAYAYTRLKHNGILLVHDYRQRANYASITKLYNLVGIVNSLAFFKQKRNRDWGSVFKKFLTDPS